MLFESLIYIYYKQYFCLHLGEVNRYLLIRSAHGVVQIHYALISDDRRNTYDGWRVTWASLVCAEWLHDLIINRACSRPLTSMLIFGFEFSYVASSVWVNGENWWLLCNGKIVFVCNVWFMIMNEDIDECDRS